MREGLLILPALESIRKRIADFQAILIAEYGLPMTVSVDMPGNDFLIDSITKVISDTLYVPMNEILGTRRRTPEKEARHVAMYICLKYIPRITLEEIAQYFGKDHTSVMYARERITELLDLADASIKCKIELCETALKINLNPANDEKSIY